MGNSCSYIGRRPEASCVLERPECAPSTQSRTGAMGTTGATGATALPALLTISSLPALLATSWLLVCAGATLQRSQPYWLLVGYWCVLERRSSAPSPIGSP